MGNIFHFSSSNTIKQIIFIKILILRNLIFSKEKIKCCQIIFISIVCSFLEAIRFPQMVEHEDGASFDNVKTTTMWES